MEGYGQWFTPSGDRGVDPSGETAAVDRGIVWTRSARGDTEVPDREWTAWPIEWGLEAEVAFQQYIVDNGADLRLRRCKIGVDTTGDGKALLPWTRGTTYSVDFLLMTCMEQAPSDARSKVVPLRRLEGGRQIHPPPGRPHPWFLKRVQDRDSRDWFNNDFFFRAFTKAMNDAGHEVKAEANDMFDFRFNQDFRGKPEGEAAMRGGVEYKEPSGWKKFATRVKGTFDHGPDGQPNNDWLCLDGRPNEWAIAYHGTKFATMPGILSGGLKVGERQAFKDHKDARDGSKIGSGIYCTPRVSTAADYSPSVEVEGKKIQFVFQCRVRPVAIKRIHEEVGRESGAYWLINDPLDIRPYGVLAREEP